jgi:H3 lysine-79-specific histone-lysine N-methyltransferase
LCPLLIDRVFPPAVRLSPVAGVGQVVLQVSGEAQCVSSFGVEKQDVPAAYATTMQQTFADRMRWFGKQHGSFEIVQGDFLEERFLEHIQEADIIFVNNFAFGASVNQALKERFVNAKEGARIVSSLNFSPLSFTITERTLSGSYTLTLSQARRPYTSHPHLLTCNS